MDEIDLEWENYLTTNAATSGLMDETIEKKDVNQTSKPYNNDFIPKCSDIYISTQTKIAYLNHPINLGDVFWKIPIIEYHDESEGIIKKQMKINNTTQKEVDDMETKIKETTSYIEVDIISKINNVSARKTKFKDVRKINIGLCKKDLMSYRIKKRGAFYNCFVLIMRIKGLSGRYQESHIKVFNTGKLEIPGIQENSFLTLVLEKLVKILSPYIDDLKVIHDKTETVLINSNFTSNFFINRHALADILKFKYKIHVVYDPCSYPGIQCKFYFNSKNKIHDGTCKCSKRCDKSNRYKINSDSSCSEISFMIFRTGSVLIVGHCSEETLHIIYKCVKNILLTEAEEIYIKGDELKKTKTKKVWKKHIYVDC
jgi:hypothetical protein